MTYIYPLIFLDSQAREDAIALNNEFSVDPVGVDPTIDTLPKVNINKNCPTLSYLSAVDIAGGYFLTLDILLNEDYKTYNPALIELLFTYPVIYADPFEIEVQE